MSVGSIKFYMKPGLVSARILWMISKILNLLMIDNGKHKKMKGRMYLEKLYSIRTIGDTGGILCVPDYECYTC